MINFIPAHDRLVLTLVEKPKTTESGLILPDGQRDPWSYGLVEAVGPLVKSADIGNIIVFYNVDGTPLEIDNVMYATIRDSHVVGIYKDKK